jgi:hypothetical protein
MNIDIFMENNLDWNIEFTRANDSNIRKIFILLHRQRFKDSNAPF